MQNKLIDKFGRFHDYLRISVTDRCNLRCTYCMGPDGVKLLKHSAILSYEEIIRVVTVAAELGIKKIRITGGEPLVRKGIEGLVAQIAEIPGIEDLSLTTNGLLLAEKAAELKKAGIKRVNISLDSLNPRVYREITRCGSLQKALEGIEAALEYGFHPVKINVVLMKGINDGEIEDFIKMVLQRPIDLRFIEYMHLDNHDKGWKDKYLSLDAVKEKALAMGYPLQPSNNKEGCGPAETYDLPGAQGSVGLIHPISGHFCSKCNRLRLTADGYLKPCLFWQEEIAVRPVLKDYDALKELMGRVLQNKRERHSMSADDECSWDEVPRAMSKIGG